MEQLKVMELKTGQFMSEDSYIFEDLFFLPANCTLKQYHLDLLNEFEIDTVFTDGGLNQPGVPKQEQKSDLEALFDDEDNNLVKVDDEEEEEEAAGETGALEEINLQDSFKDLYKRWILGIKNFFYQIINNKTIDKQIVVNLLNDIEQFIDRDKNQALMLFGQTFEGIQPLYRQTIETVILSYIMAKNMQLKEFAKTNLVISALFHDIGMVRIPQQIMEKKEKLTPQELATVQSHTVIGFRLLREAKYSAIIASGALQHHERVDGKGYPSHITSDKITQIGKIIGIIDAYCAAISAKPFRNPVHAKEAVQELLKKGGTMYDLGMLREFVKIISFYPIGSLVLLSNDIPAKVVGTSGVGMRPVVTTIVNGKESETINLSQSNLYIKGVYVQKKTEG